MSCCYIAGPMRGRRYFNFPAFDAKRDELVAQGHEVRSPADMDRAVGFDAMKMPDDFDWGSAPDSFDLSDCINRDLDAVEWCDEIHLLEGWENSTGTTAEIGVGKWWGKKIVYPEGGEQRITDKTTGASKCQKLARFALLPAQPLWELAEHYGKGCAKYSERNWERGYDWSLSYGAAQRHLNRFWNGEDCDPETQSKHIIAAAWHCLAIAEFMATHPEKDDRSTTPKGENI